MYQVLVVEDSDEEFDRLQAVLDRYAAEHGCAFAVERDRSALVLATEKRSFDLVFMDIGLPGIDGMEAAQLMRGYDQETPLIFVTNLAQFALKGYEVDALDFVLKPVSYERVEARLTKALRVADRRASHKITVRTRDGVRVLNATDIVSVEVTDHRLVYRLIGQEEPVQAHGSLVGVERQLDEEGLHFVRVSSSCLANMALIRNVGREALDMADGSSCWFSRAKRKPALASIAEYLGGTV